MKKIVILVLFAFTLTSAGSYSSKVYLCMGPSSKKYHYNPNCRGLSNCSTGLLKVSLSDARQKYGRGLCGWED